MARKMWGGRFEGLPAQEVIDFTFSVAVDGRLWPQDIRVSMAHARMLGERKIIPQKEAWQIIEGLSDLFTDLETGRMQPDVGAEDVHTFVEEQLFHRIGLTAGKLHTGRSRNDQVATDTRLWAMESIDDLSPTVAALQQTLVDIAKKHRRTILPGLTHQQHAQPVSLAHHLLAYFWMLQRDRERLSGVRDRADWCPLGAAALAGTGFAIDRQMTAVELGFSRVAPNSMDAVADRDYVIEFVATCAMVMMHLSRLAQDLINWSMPEFGFVTLDDGYATGSSIMPQKKNPDVCELIRGRSARVAGHLVASLATMKGLPLAYNRDFQDDKLPLFESYDLTAASLWLMQGMLESAQFHPKAMRAKLRGDFSTATELADYLARTGMAFRDAHEVVGEIVRHCIARGHGLEALTLEGLREFSKSFKADAISLLKPETALMSRNSEGGTAPDAVSAQLRLARRALRARM